MIYTVVDDMLHWQPSFSSIRNKTQTSGQLFTNWSKRCCGGLYEDAYYYMLSYKHALFKWKTSSGLLIICCEQNNTILIPLREVRGLISRAWTCQRTDGLPVHLCHPSALNVSNMLCPHVHLKRNVWLSRETLIFSVLCSSDTSG